MIRGIAPATALFALIACGSSGAPEAVLHASDVDAREADGGQAAADPFLFDASADTGKPSTPAPPRCEEAEERCSAGCCTPLTFTRTSYGVAGRHLSLMVDANDQDHLGYGGFVPNDYLWYRPPSGLPISVASPRPSQYGSISMTSTAALDANGTPVFAYTYDSLTWPELHISRGVPGTNQWSAGELDIGNAPRKALANGGAKMALAVLGYEVDVRYLDDPTRVVLQCPGFGSGAHPPAIALDGAGLPHVACHRWDATTNAHADVVWATLDATGATKIETVDAAASAKRRTQDATIALAPDGTPHVAYYDTVKREVVHASRSGGAWTKTTVAAFDPAVPAQGAPTPALALVSDANGDAHLFFAHDRKRELLHARQTPSGFVVRPVPGVTSVSLDIVARRDSKGRLHVAFQVPPADSIEVVTSSVP